MRLEQKYLEDLRAEKIFSQNYFLNKLINDKKEIVSTVLSKNGEYWLYHKNTLEEHEDEKGNPAEKLWLIIRHMQKDHEHEFISGQGLKIELGDTLKFGRVRYKII